MYGGITKKGNNKIPTVSKMAITATFKENFAYRSQMAVSVFVQPVYFLVHYFNMAGGFSNPRTGFWFYF